MPFDPGDLTTFNRPPDLPPDLTCRPASPGQRTLNHEPPDTADTPRVGGELFVATASYVYTYTRKNLTLFQ